MYQTGVQVLDIGQYGWLPWHLYLVVSCGAACYGGGIGRSHSAPRKQGSVHQRRDSCNANFQSACACLCAFRSKTFDLGSVRIIKDVNRGPATKSDPGPATKSDPRPSSKEHVRAVSAAYATCKRAASHSLACIVQKRTSARRRRPCHGVYTALPGLLQWKMFEYPQLR